MNHDYYRFDEMCKMDYVDEAYKNGLDIDDYATADELLDALYRSSRSSASYEELEDDLYTFSGSYASGSGSAYSRNPSYTKSSVKTTNSMPYVPPKPTPPSIGILFPIYIIAIAFLVLGALIGLTCYGRAKDWTDWVEFIFSTIFLFIIPICLKISWYRSDLEIFKREMAKYKQRMRS